MLDDKQEFIVDEYLKLFLASFMLLELKYNLKTSVFIGKENKILEILMKLNFAKNSSNNKSLEFLSSYLGLGHTPPSGFYSKLNIYKFDKEDDLIINFIFAASNLRAWNFGIKHESRFKVKDIAGNIIPAIASTNAIIAAVQAMEAIKLLLGLVAGSSISESLKILKNSSFNIEKKIRSETSVNNLKNEACVTCANDNFTTNLEINLEKFTLQDLVDVICSQVLKIQKPIIFTEKIILYEFDDVESAEEGSESYNNNNNKKSKNTVTTTLLQLGIKNGSKLKIEETDENANENMVYLFIVDNSNLEGLYSIGDLSYYDNKLKLKKPKSQSVKSLNANELMVLDEDGSEENMQRNIDIISNIKTSIIPDDKGDLALDDEECLLHKKRQREEI